MRFQHRTTLQAQADRVWPLLEDVSKTALCIPGVESVRPAGEGVWAGVMKVRVGPVGLDLQGRVTLQARDPKARRLQMSIEAGDPRVGASVLGALTVTLEEAGAGATALVVDADVNLLGRLAGLGQAIIRLKAEDTLRQFARNLSQRLARPA